MPASATPPDPCVRLAIPLFAALASAVVGCAGPEEGEPQPPSVEILFPKAEQTITGASVSLCARIYDPDNSLPNLTVKAEIDGATVYEKVPGDDNAMASTYCTAAGKNGNLGLSLVGLNPGEHTLRVDVGDPAGGQSNASVPFTIEGGHAATPTPHDLNPDTPNTRPRCQMVSPTADVPYQALSPIVFEVAVSDDEDDASGLMVMWSSSPAAASIDGQGGYASFASATRFTTAELGVGTWDVKATVVDRGAAEAECLVRVRVVACEDGDGDGVLPCGDAPVDCDDDDALVFPGQTDGAGQGDEDCDGRIDEDAPTGPTDDDGDGFTGGPGGDGDCDDRDPHAYPGAAEAGDGRDNDCDGTVDETTWLYDDDGDGHAEIDGDCDDTSVDTYPGAPEGAPAGAALHADGVDNDCDGRVDEGTDVTDDDGDGVTEAAGDCDDANSAVKPGAFDHPEGGVDDDCDGRVDEGALDLDGDGYASLGGGGPYDCDDADPLVSPGSAEACDGEDQDCDGRIDEDLRGDDADGDGYGACPTAPGGGDCDDQAAGVHPGAAEGLGPDGDEGDGVDSDCDGEVDEGTDLYDDDGDGYAEVAGALPGGDCDDGDPDVHPGHSDRTGGGDEDCDGLTDEDDVQVGDVVITEVRRQTYEEHSAALQWFEVLNTAGHPIHLAGWTVVATVGNPDDGPVEERVAVLGDTAPTLPPGAYAVVGATTDTRANGGVAVDVTYGDLVLGLGGVLTLSLGDVGVVDTVEWDDGILYPIEEGASLNLSRSAVEGDTPHLANDQPASWCIPGSFYGRDLRGTPGQENDGC